MNIIPIATARVSTLERVTSSSTSISSVEQQVDAVGQELSSGRAVTQASDNPAAAAVIQQLTQQLADSQQYQTNINAATTQLQNTDSSLSNLSTLLTQASSQAQSYDSTTDSDQERESAAQTIDGIYNQVASIANTTYGGQYVFGTDDAASTPYVQTAAGLQYNGSSATLSGQTDQSEQLSYQVSGASVFGGLSASVSAGTDLSPRVLATTRLTDLAGARNNGVTLGSIVVGNGTTTKTVDLTGADTVQDVLDDINGAGVPGVTASVGTTGIDLAGAAGGVSVADVTGGTAAADLGIAQATPAATVTGLTVHTDVTQLTKLSDLRGGAGIDPTGFTIRTATATKTISLAGLSTVQDLVNAVNTAGLGVQASVRADGTGIDLSNATQGSDLTVSEAGGTTAAELGFTTLKPATALASLNKNTGVSTPAGTQFTIATADGSKIPVGLTGITAVSTVQDAIDQINAAAGGKVTASLDTTGSGIVLTDHTTGGGTLGVATDNAATTAADLGLTTGTVSGNRLTGTDVNPVRVPGLLTDLNDLRVALRSNDTDGIDTAAKALEADSERVATVRGVVGGRVQELTSRTSTLTIQDTTTSTELSSLQDVDYATTVTQFQALQDSLQASLQVTSKTLSLSLSNYLA